MVPPTDNAVAIEYFDASRSEFGPGLFAAKLPGCNRGLTRFSAMVAESHEGGQDSIPWDMTADKQDVVIKKARQ